MVQERKWCCGRADRWWNKKSSKRQHEGVSEFTEWRTVGLAGQPVLPSSSATLASVSRRFEKESGSWHRSSSLCDL